MNRPAADHLPASQCSDLWWRGIPGMDPQLPVSDIGYASALAASAMAARYLTLEVRGRALLNHRPASYGIAARWREWLNDSPDLADFHYRRVILWQVCQHQQDPEPDQILRVADELYVSVPLGGEP